MGTLLESYGNDGHDHQGYAAQVLDDGSLTSTYSDETQARMVGQVVPACGCGWTGTTRYPTTTGQFDQAAEELALDEWERDHARPTLEGLRAAGWDRLHAVVRQLAASRTAKTTGAQFIAVPPAEQLDMLDATLAALNRATALAGQLRAPLETTRGGERP